jgi:DNA-directed RNA polymerase subunit H (RpoH/RPB5)
MRIEGEKRKTEAPKVLRLVCLYSSGARMKMTAKKDENVFNIFESGLVPKQILLGGEEKAELLKRFNISLKQLPRIKREDPVAEFLGAKRGDVIKVLRDKETEYYRVVV